MIHRLLKSPACLCAFLLLGCPSLFSQVRLPRVIGDSMVLQRDARIRIWGWAAAGEKVKIRFNGKNFSTTTNADGKWVLLLPAMKAGGPYTMDIVASNRISLKDILVGDVWICSGQSNMVLPMERVKEKYPEEIAGAHYSAIRHFFIPTMYEFGKMHDDLPSGSWKPADPQNVLQFSAAAYFFAKAIYEKYHVPIGLINSSVGGTPVEAWISEEGLKPFPGYLEAARKFSDKAYVDSVKAASSRPSPLSNQKDKGLNGAHPWYDTAYVPDGWHPIEVPGYWADQGIKGLNGVVWYRKEIEVPATMTGMPAKLFMGRIIDADYLYVNGVLAGSVAYQYPPRRYELPAGLLKPGKNIIVIRVVNFGGKGGFVPDKPYYIAAGGQTIGLKGDWQYKVGEAFAPDPMARPVVSLQNQPAGLFNAMIAPLVNYAVKGFLWYQGESNAGRPADYRELLTALIGDWRRLWSLGELPFLYVQLPNFMEVQYLPSESQWALLREAQLKTLSVSHTAMTVTIDLGEWNDVHPLNKKAVGDRLAYAAEKLAYGSTDVVASGPLYHSSKIDGNRVIIDFTNTGSGLMAKDGDELEQFAIAGSDKKFVWAKAVIRDNQVIVWSDELPHPAYVRYAWADNPDGANLYNREGLPASPFRTDE